MPITVASLKAELIEEFGPVMSAAGMTESYLLGPIRKAIVAGGGTIADPPSVTDADAQSATAPFDTLVTVAKLHLIRKFLGNYTGVDMKSGEESQSLSQLAKRMQELQTEEKEDIIDPDNPLIEKQSTPPQIGIIQEGTTIRGGVYPFVAGWPLWSPF
jgi:hypothetical protein